MQIGGGVGMDGLVMAARYFRAELAPPGANRLLRRERFVEQVEYRLLAFSVVDVEQLST